MDVISSGSSAQEKALGCQEDERGEGKAQESIDGAVYICGVDVRDLLQLVARKDDLGKGEK